MQNRLIKHGHDMGRFGTLKDCLPIQPRFHQAVSLFVISPRRQEQRPRVLGRLEQPGNDDGLPVPQHQRLALSFEVGLEPRRYGSVRRPGQLGEPPEQIVIQAAGRTPRGQDIRCRGTFPRLRLSDHRPVKPQAGR